MQVRSALSCSCVWGQGAATTQPEMLCRAGAGHHRAPDASGSGALQEGEQDGDEDARLCAALCHMLTTGESPLAAFQGLVPAVLPASAGVSTGRGGAAGQGLLQDCM